VDENGEIRKQHTGFNCDSITFWITTSFFVIFQLELVWKYIQGFVYTVKGWACRSVYKNLQWEKYYIEKQIKCDTDIGMLRLIDVFMDSGKLNKYLFEIRILINFVVVVVVVHRSSSIVATLCDYYSKLGGIRQC